MIPLPAGARLVDDRDELAAFFSDRPDVHAYALGDLEEPFWSGSTWWRRGDAVVGLVALPSGEGLACYAVSTRDRAGTLDLVADLAPALPAGQLITGPTGLAETLAPIRPLAWDGPHLRYVLADRSLLPPLPAGIERIGTDTIDELRALYDTEPGAAFFLPHMVSDGAFYGVRVDGRLVAAAGTHVLCERRGVAAIGAVYTAPAHRGRGHGRAVTVAVCRHVADRVAVVGLNVTVENAVARHLYEAIGFIAIHPYEEAQLA